MKLRYTEQIFSEKDACSAGDLISLRYVEVYVHVLARVVISRVDLYNVHSYPRSPFPVVRKSAQNTCRVERFIQKA